MRDSGCRRPQQLGFHGRVRSKAGTLHICITDRATLVLTNWLSKRLFVLSTCIQPIQRLRVVCRRVRKAQRLCYDAVEIRESSDSFDPALGICDELTRARFEWLARARMVSWNQNRATHNVAGLGPRDVPNTLISLRHALPRPPFTSSAAP